MRFSGTAAIALLATITSKNVSASDSSWSGKLDLKIFLGASGCNGNATYSGYTSGVQAIGNGDICETDHYDLGEGMMTYYTKWVTVCGSQGPLPSAMYQVSIYIQIISLALKNLI